MTTDSGSGGTGSHLAEAALLAETMKRRVDPYSPTYALTMLAAAQTHATIALTHAVVALRAEVSLLRKEASKR
jgi:hypothetical protein